MRHDDAGSNSIGTILIIAVTIILAILVLLLCLRFSIPKWNFTPIPAIFVITNVVHVDDYTGNMNYDSRLIVKHTGTKTYNNANLKASIYRNGKKLNCVIDTLRATDFMSTVHLGVQWIGYAGCSGNTWLPGEMSAIDLKDGTFRPGDTAQIDIIDKSTDEVISRHVYKVT